MSFVCLFEGIDTEEGYTVSTIVGSKAMLRGIQEVVCFPGVADTVCEDTGP